MSRKKKNNEISFLKIVEDMKAVSLFMNGLSLDEDKKEELKNNYNILSKDIDDLKEWYRSTRGLILSLFVAILIFIVMAIILGIASTTLSNRVNHLNSIIDEKNNKIDDLQWSDSMLVKFMGVTYDSTSHQRMFYNRKENGKDLTYGDLAKEKDSLENNKYNIEATLKDSISNIQDKLDILNIKLSLIEDNYPIFFRETPIKEKDGSLVTNYTIMAKQLDSALMLLQVYRNNLKYDSSTHKWQIFSRSSK